ncbi:MAG: 1-(5-phosphoribosyl)-5-[(5-phosphoribosylamino)methylideneamino] imidazole-4-carboxamide isomerase [Acidimicrobiales bacterium]|nr:1-(5-phosphoribosyl)-5-[(5-phosphoribosylamino)methylideneamino] imidazole-4-carboxamide isomerase [Acidimicrobiales bacterium]
MDLYPAIDILGGRVVQLVQGDFDNVAVHGDDPAAVARAFEQAGVPWIHCVDLDAARTGELVNRPHIAAVVEAVSVPVQVGGGVRSADAARALDGIGVTRVVIGTAAFEEPEIVEAIAAQQRVAIGLDIRGREVAIRGWTAGAGVEWDQVLARLAGAGAEAVVVTQIEREGLMGGPDVAGLTEMLAATDLDVIASGGVSSLDDLRALDAVEVDGRGLAGAIVGTAVYEGAVPVERAVEVLRCAPRG